MLSLTTLAAVCNLVSCKNSDFFMALIPALIAGIGFEVCRITLSVKEDCC